MLIAFPSLVKYGFVSPPSAGKQIFVPRLLEKRYITFTANYTKIDSGYMGQLIEWQEVITEGETLELCRESLQDALQEMIAAYKQQNKEIPSSKSLIEQIPVEV